MIVKRLFKALLLVIFVIMTNTLFSQNKRLKVEIENISLKAPSDWKAQKQDTPEGFTIRLSNEKNPNHIIVNCIKKTTNLEATIVNAASQKSTLSGFEYMLIEKVHSKKFNDYNAKFLEYTNSPLRDYFRGGFYSFIDKGYTYVLDYYSFDTPEARGEVGKIVSSLKILPPESRPNFFVVEEEYLPKNIIVEKPVIEDTSAQTVSDTSTVKNHKHFLFFGNKETNKAVSVSQQPKEENSNVQPVLKEQKAKKSIFSIFKKKNKNTGSK